MKNTTIKLTPELKDKLENLKVPKDTYSDVVDRLLRLVKYIEETRGIRVYESQDTC